jgi:hypothetical protein
VLVKIGPKHWDRYRLKSWIEAARKRLHHNVPAIALANKLARIVWAVLHKGRAFPCTATQTQLRQALERTPSKRWARKTPALIRPMKAVSISIITHSFTRPADNQTTRHLAQSKRFALGDS